MTPATTALVTGVGGQDGVYLARLLRSQGHRVVGTLRPGPPLPTRVYLDGVELVEHDLVDTAGFAALLAAYRPAQVYNLAAFSAVGASFDHPVEVAEVNADAVTGLLDALVAHRAATGEEVRFFQASSALASTEATAEAASPYAAAKRRAQAAVARYRREHGLHASAALLHNHESPLRPTGFVFRKITRAAAEIACGVSDRLRLGNLDVHRDWGHARDHVAAMTLMLDRDTPGDLELGTGVSHSLEDLLVGAFAAAGLGDPWRYVEQDPALLRPQDTAALVADTAAAETELGWKAATTFADLVEEMVAVDLRRVRSGVEESPAYLT